MKAILLLLLYSGLVSFTAVSVTLSVVFGYQYLFSFWVICCGWLLWLFADCFYFTNMPCQSGWRLQWWFWWMGRGVLSRNSQNQIWGKKLMFDVFEVWRAYGLYVWKAFFVNWVSPTRPFWKNQCPGSALSHKEHLEVSINHLEKHHLLLNLM